MSLETLLCIFTWTNHHPFQSLHSIHIFGTLLPPSQKTLHHSQLSNIASHPPSCKTIILWSIDTWSIYSPHSSLAPQNTLHPSQLSNIVFHPHSYRNYHPWPSWHSIHMFNKHIPPYHLKTASLSIILHSHSHKSYSQMHPHIFHNAKTFILLFQLPSKISLQIYCILYTISFWLVFKIFPEILYYYNLLSKYPP